MISKTAMEDLKALRADGYRPTDEEVVRLNDLGVRIEKGRDTTPANMPRVAFAGNVVLHEPTVGSETWWEDYGRDSAMTSQGRFNAYFFMLANARRVERLNSLTEPKAIRKAVAEWKKTCAATENELWRAMMWVKYGPEGPGEPGTGTDSSLESEERRAEAWRTVAMAAGALGTNPEELLNSTRSQLVDMLVQANLHARIPMKQSVARDYMAYRQVLREIEERGNG